MHALEEEIMIDRHKLGLVFGTFLGAWHFVWAGLVLSGIAQSLMNWIFRLHFIDPPYSILPFNIGAAITLILLTSITGYLSGWVFGAIWNWVRANNSQRESIPSLRRHATGH